MTWNARIDAEGGVEYGRLERGLGLHAERVEPQRYRVSGGHAIHWVDLTHESPHCDCGDHTWRDQICKHIIAALLREGNERIIHAVGGLVRNIRQDHAAEAA
jgi:hypothetical protein